MIHELIRGEDQTPWPFQCDMHIRWNSLASCFEETNQPDVKSVISCLHFLSNYVLFKPVHVYLYFTNLNHCDMIYNNNFCKQFFLIKMKAKVTGWAQEQNSYCLILVKMFLTFMYLNLPPSNDCCCNRIHHVHSKQLSKSLSLNSTRISQQISIIF